MKLEEKFCDLICQIKDPVIFIGIAKILKVDIIDNEKNPYPFEKVAIEIIEKFGQSNRKRKRELYKILKQSIKEGELDAAGTEDTSTTTNS